MNTRGPRAQLVSFAASAFLMVSDTGRAFGTRSCFLGTNTGSPHAQAVSFVVSAFPMVLTPDKRSALVGSIGHHLDRFGSHLSLP